jgi:hypothetical protein
MKIYEVTGYDSGGPTTYYEPTLRAAEYRKREMKKQATKHDPWDAIEIKPVTVMPTRVGIARAMQYVINMTCANEH